MKQDLGTLTVRLEFDDAELRRRLDALADRAKCLPTVHEKPDVGIVAALTGAAALAVQGTKPVTRRSLFGLGWLRRTRADRA